MALDQALTLALVNFRNPVLNYTFIGISFLGSLGFLLFAIILLWLIKRRRESLILFLAAITNWVVVYALKFTINRPRPDVSTLVDTLTPSFPSAHSSNILLLTVLLTLYNRKYWPILIFAPLVCFSRLYLGVHFLSDVLVGAAIGTSFAFLFFTKEKKILKFLSR